MVRTRSREVAAISREVAPISVVVAAVSVAVACCCLEVAAISVTEVVTCTDERWAWDTSDGQLGHHVVEAGFHGAEFVLALQVQARAEVAGAHDFEDLHDAVHRRHDRAHQQQAAEAGGQHGDQQGNAHADFRGDHGVIDGRHVLVGHRSCFRG